MERNKKHIKSVHVSKYVYKIQKTNRNVLSRKELLEINFKENYVINFQFHRNRI